MRQTANLLFEQYSKLAETIENLEGQIRAHAKQDDDARRLLTVPGIGPVTASLIVASVTDIGAFDIQPDTSRPGSDLCRANTHRAERPGWAELPRRAIGK